MGKGDKRRSFRAILNTGTQYYFAALIVILVIAIGSVLLPSKPGIAISSDTLSFEQPKQFTEPMDYFIPFWEYARPEDMHAGTKVSTSTYAIGLDSLVADPESRLGPDFAMGPDMRLRVLFWVDVYAKYGSHIRIVHDRLRPWVVYGLIDFGPLRDGTRTKMQVELAERKFESVILKTIRSEIISQFGTDTGQAQPRLKAFLLANGIESRADASKSSRNVRTQTGQQDHFQAALHRAQNFLPHIDAVFKDRNLPSVLGRIPFVESSFNNIAYSKAGAVGIWQFTPPTARQMISSSDPSKWSDPVLQTKAAAKLLTMYRRILPDWSTAITAYNSGVGNVKRNLKRNRASSIEALLKVQHDNGLGFAGENFYACVVAATLVEKYKSQIFVGWLSKQSMKDAFQPKGQPFDQQKCKVGAFN